MGLEDAYTVLAGWMQLSLPCRMTKKWPDKGATNSAE
jgi:hypothetical protein